jgi:uncharacterized protein
MATPSPAPSPSPSPEKTVRLVPREEPTTGPLAGDPAIVGLPAFIVGSVAFGLVLTNVLPAAAAGAAMPIILAASAGLFLATIWSARIGQNAQAGLFGIVASFFLSYAILVIGLTHTWFAILAGPTVSPLAAVADTQKMFVISWLVIVTMLVLATLRLPMIYTVLFVLVDVALLLDLLGIIQTSASLTKAAGWVTMGFAALAVYLFFSAASHVTGGKELPLGKPLLHT